MSQYQLIHINSSHLPSPSPLQPSRRPHRQRGRARLEAPVPAAVQPAVSPGVDAAVFDHPFEPAVLTAARHAHVRLRPLLGRRLGFGAKGGLRQFAELLGESAQAIQEPQLFVVMNCTSTKGLSHLRTQHCQVGLSEGIRGRGNHCVYSQPRWPCTVQALVVCSTFSMSQQGVHHKQLTPMHPCI